MPAPTLSDAHNVRIASAFRRDRKRVNETFGGSFPIQEWNGSAEEREKLLEELRRAVYEAFLAAFAQGINVS